MKEFLKDYGTLIGPLLAFTLGVIAFYIKFYIDRQVENWRSRKKMQKLVQLIATSKPPLKYYPLKSEDGFHADQARNLTNLSIFFKRLEVILAYIDSVENDILTNCSIGEIQQFHDLKFIVNYLSKDLEKARNKGVSVSGANSDSPNNYSESDFLQMHQTYERLMTVCKNPEKEFKYIER